MDYNSAGIAEAYYVLMGRKDFAKMEEYLHPSVQLVGPLGTVMGKKEVFEAAKSFASLIENLTIRAKFGSGNRAMVVYDFHFPAPVGNSSGAVLLTFQDGLIIKYELFYDSRPFVKYREEIFS